MTSYRSYARRLRPEREWRRVADGGARRRDVSRSQIYQWRAALREGRLSEPGGEVVGFVPVAIPLAPGTAPNDDLPGTDSVAAVSPIKIGLPGGGNLKVPASLPTADLWRLIRVVEGA